MFSVWSDALYLMKFVFILNITYMLVHDGRRHNFPECIIFP